jgi:hypothetical protein
MLKKKPEFLRKSKDFLGRAENGRIFREKSSQNLRKWFSASSGPRILGKGGLWYDF